jgi:hypothetical protein
MELGWECEVFGERRAATTGLATPLIPGVYAGQFAATL